SNHIFRPARVETPFDLSTTRLIGYLVTILPCEERPLMATSAKSRSNCSLRSLEWARSCTFTTSASPLGLAVKYSTFDPLLPLLRSYSLSRVIPSTENRLTYDTPDLASR